MPNTLKYLFYIFNERLLFWKIINEWLDFFFKQLMDDFFLILDY
jgi:hypothetical protein